MPEIDPWNLLVDRRTVLRIGGGAAVVAVLAACSGGPRPAPSTPAATPTPTPTSSGGWPPPAEPMAFPTGFTWGAATSAFQVEGSTKADGRGVSMWDTFAAVPGNIDDGSTGDPAADHYRRWESDLDLMAELGLGAYRFSVAWPRVLPTGAGKVNAQGVDFYRRLVDGLGERGIAPAVTLYHWDLPQPLQDAGGWANRDTAKRFADYAAVMFEALHDVDVTWLTINEPKTTAYQGYGGTEHAPGAADWDQAVAAVHHQLLGHGLAVQAFRAQGGPGGIGIALNLQPVYPVGNAKSQAARVDAAKNRLFLDPVLLGTYPEDAIGDRGGQIAADPAKFRALVHDGDLDVISSPCDVLAVQYYGVAAINDTGDWVELYPASPAGWQQVHAEGLYDLLMRLKADYPDAPPIIITENGIPDPAPEGAMQDDDRLTFLREHLQQAARAIGDGADLHAYYAWSLLDNFEWARGMTQRWGLVHVDYDTQERTPKASAHWYSGVITTNAVAPA